ncbi:MAG: 2-oxoacid:acceptor oxidoreductase subunit alpha [Schleiferiaceae bacterium]|nr:2-oxoacid:acceptor oxidoreductase subunit alpha [Schleiferiaceae bacterium]
MATQLLEKATVLFAGDSGDGMQLTGSQFSLTTALHGNDLATFPDFPAEIRAPIGTVSGVSGFKVNFGSTRIFTSGGKVDTLVAMNVAALVKNLDQLKANGLIIVNEGGFDARNLKLANYTAGQNPLTDGTLSNFQVITIDVNKLVKELLKDSPLGNKDRDRTRNMFMLGFVYWLYNRNPESTLQFLARKFAKLPDVMAANIAVFKAGLHYADTTELFSNRYEIQPAQMPPGKYRNIMGNEGLALGLVAASKKAGLDLFYAGYPITPASDILHELSNHKNFGVRTFQAEDEIAAIGAAIGASFGGHIGATGTSGPGMALKTEAMGLAFMIELPLVIVNVQRGGPSTGLPTKTEQADLLQAMFGRNGEAPMPVLACATPSDCFEVAFEATRIAIEHMTPVILLSDGYIANGAEPWPYPQAADLPTVTPPFATAETPYQPYFRDEKHVRQWAIPGMKGMQHRVGGLEKQELTGNVSYDAENHERMVKTRAAKVAAIANSIPEQQFDSGSTADPIVVVSWGSTYGASKVALANLRKEGVPCAHIHLRYLNPFPKNLGALLAQFSKVIVPELNDGQLVVLLRRAFLTPTESLTKIQGKPFLAAEIEAFVKQQYATL